MALSSSASTTTTLLLTQTAQRPSTAGPFTAQMTQLWNDIITNNVKDADTLFFPLPAYEKLKVIGSPSYDWHTRLMALFNLDFAAYHRELTAGSVATLSRVAVNPSFVQWIPKGACYNTVGFWHLPGPRFVYTQGGVTKSLGVLSLISWRGVWYFIHLGPNPRPRNVGTLFSPAIGPGVVGPPGSC